MNFLKRHFVKMLLVISLVSVSSASGVFLVGQFAATKQQEKFTHDVAGVATESVTGTPSASQETASTSSPTPTSKPSTAPIVVYKEPLPTPTQTPMPTQDTKMDSATHIELCKTKAETHKTQTMTALVLVYNQNNADAMKIANTSSVEELVEVGISIGLLTREQYNSDPSGHQLALLKLREKVMAEIKSFMDTVNGKGSLAYSDYYAKCLSNEN